MNQDTIALLKECSSGCKMAQKSVKHVQEYTKSDKLISVLQSYTEKHMQLDKEIAVLLSKYEKEESEPKIMAVAGAWMNVEVKMAMHQEDRQVAKLMMDGCNMGIQSVSEYVNKYRGASQESQNLAKKLIKLEEDFMKEMKEFV